MVNLLYTQTKDGFVIAIDTGNRASNCNAKSGLLICTILRFDFFSVYNLYMIAKMQLFIILFFSNVIFQFSDIHYNFAEIVQIQEQKPL